MTRPTSSARRVAALAALGVAAAGISAVTVSTPAQAAGSLAVDKSFAYTCDVTVEGILLKGKAVGVTTKTNIPVSVTPGEVIPPTPVSIDLTLPEDLRAFTYDSLDGRFADGSSSDSAVTLASNGATQVVTFTVAAPKTAIPATSASPWLVSATGTVPAITTPANAKDVVTLSMPQRFTINATVYRDDTFASSFNCTGPADLTLGTIPVLNVAPKFTRSAYKVKGKKNKAVRNPLRASDANGDVLKFKAAKTSKGKVVIKGSKVVFKPKKNWKGKTVLKFTASDSKGGTARTRVVVTVK